MRGRITWSQRGEFAPSNRVRGSQSVQFDWKMSKPIKEESLIDIQVDILDPIPNVSATGQLMEGGGGICRMKLFGDVSDELISKGIHAKITITEQKL
jgi:hypothetical protein